MNSTQSQWCKEESTSLRSASVDVEIVLFDGFSLPGVAAVIEVFHRANAAARTPSGGAPLYNVSLLSASGGSVVSSSAVHVCTENAAAQRASSPTILLFIAGGAGAERAACDERLSAWVRQRHAVSTIVCPISEGQLILDAVGLAARYDEPHADAPNVHHIHRHDQAHSAHAVRAALRTPKENPRDGMLERLARALAPDTDDADADISFDAALPHPVSDKIMASARWLQANAERPISIELAAEVAAMSERNFLRRFKAEIGVTPSDYLQRARLELSCRMLIESQLPVDKIARRCGIGSGGQLAKLFKKHLSTTPTEYRSRNAGGHRVFVRPADSRYRGALHSCT
ncbi:helix-turn-helix domain-containing protein [Caballeronia sp. ATUFL_M2_KS44]|uniref:helix-turn-helix domain-containing protein n=1 Tax=Caballeronia sp. ATUFL_M2_KS44 TaxID=2921767 RepID=UPI002028173B|nr:helix-turn-helix domain-containing protein [Caballeronia sp. ATUFL_M2_KS44]